MTTTDREKQKSRRRGDVLWFAGGAVVVALVIAAMAQSSSGSEDATDSNWEPPEPTTHEVLYEVEGSTDWADVTMATPTGTRQVSPDVPMTRKSGEPGAEMTVEPGEFLYISAQNKERTGTIACRITVDGEVISENESSGAYAIASCEGSVD